MSDRDPGHINPWLLDGEYAEHFARDEQDPLDRGEVDFLPPERSRPGECVPSRMRPCEDDAEHLVGSGRRGFAGMDLVLFGKLRRW